MNEGRGVTVRMKAARVLALLGASATVTAGVASCVPRNQDINRVQPGFVRKAIFQTDHEWYYRRTVARSETTNQYIIEGHGDIALDRVKFDVQENLLLAYQPYENLPGTTLATLPGNTSYKGPVLAAWPITSHFDIIRNYDPLTGNLTNLIVENTVDRPWHEREFIRVDWHHNLVEGSIFADYSGYWFPVNYVSADTGFWRNLEESPTDPFASRFSDDYVEVNETVALGMDIFMCASMTGFSWAGFSNCGFGEAQLRHSFKRIDEPSDYIPREFPDSIVRKGADGQPMFDPETGEVVREHIYNRFGIFRITTPTYDPGYGLTESGRLFRAMLFDIWERHTDAQGTPLPFAARTEKPIVYYLNHDYPNRYRQVAREVADEYNRVFTSMVADLKGVEYDPETNNCGEGWPVQCMFEIRDNDCSEPNVIRYVNDNPDLLFAVERAVCRDGESCGVTLADLSSAIGVGNLDQVCTSLEAATVDPQTGKSDFDWQRVGDPRYNMLVYLNNPQRSPWGGYGPMHADSRTGRTVSATSFIRGHYYEIGAANVVDYIELINDEKSIDDIIYGQDIRRHVRDTLQRGGFLANMQASPGFLDRLGERISDRGVTRDELLPRVENTRHQMSRLDRIKGTKFEDTLITEADLLMASNGQWDPRLGPAPDDLKEHASPLGRLTFGNPASPQRRAAQAALGEAGYCFLAADFDPHWAGMALALRDADREERFRVASERLIKHVILHELGHNVGLAHNFEGSYDAMNYEPEFWDLEGRTAQEKLEGRQDELKQTTVMEYMPSGKGAFGDYLGKYDEAALRFAYGNQVEVFDGPDVDPNLRGGEALRAWRYLNDYRSIPDHLCGSNGCSTPAQRAAVVTQRRWVDFDPQNPPQNEVPYLFCDNYFNRMTPFCATFDFGANLREVFSNYYVMWSQYFFFNNFARDRISPISWNINSALTPAFLAMNFVDTVAQYFYFLNVTQGAEFRRTALHEDMATTLANGLNMAAEIISTPDPIRMCRWPGVNPPTFITADALRSCDKYAELGSPYALRSEMIEIPLGHGRPASIGLTEDYETWQLSFVGSYFDKTNVIFLLGMSNPRLFRFNYDLDLRNYFISLYRIFEPELREFYQSLSNLDVWLGLFRQSVAQDFGSYWCRDPAVPNRPDLGYFEPRRMIDPVLNTSMPGPTQNCLEPALIYPRLLANTPFNAMLSAHALFSSDFDSQLDLGKDMKIFMRGTDDDFTSWANFPNCEEAGANEDCFCSLVDELTGVEFRSIQIASSPTLDGTVRTSPGCRLIEQAQLAQNNWRTGPFEKDNWRQWIERLEYARDLYRLFQDR